MTTAVETPRVPVPGEPDIGDYRYGWSDPAEYAEGREKGISEELVRSISAEKNEPEWMLKARLKALKIFERKSMPTWGPDLSSLDLQAMTHFARATDAPAKAWEELPESVKTTYDRLGIPEAERARLLGGVAAMYESESVYHSIQEDLAAQGVIFMDSDTALREHEGIVREYFGTVVPAGDNKFAALNTAVWSGGSFVYVPPGVKVGLPLQAYFRMNVTSEHERTLIIVDEGAEVEYMEGCSAPSLSEALLHTAVVEIIVKRGGVCRYLTLQSWSNPVLNLVTKRAAAYEDAYMRWADFNGGASVTMKYPSVYLLGERARGEVFSFAFAGADQHQDTGAKIIHAAPNTTSNIIAKSVSAGGGRSSYRGLVQVQEGAHGSKSSVVCDALLVDAISRSDTYPYVDIREDAVSMGHEATVSRIGEDQVFYLQSRGMSEQEARSMIVQGFASDFTKTLPFEFAIEMTRLLAIKMDDAVG